MLAEGLVDRGHRVRIGIVSLKPLDLDLLQGDIEVVSYSRSSTYRWDMIWRQVMSDMRQYEPDVVHAWLPEVISLPAAFTGWKLGIPVVSSVRRSLFKGIGVKNWPREVLSLLPHFFSNRIVANFSLAHEPPILRGWFKRRQALTILNGVALGPMSTNIIKSATDISLDLVFVGRFAPQKRLEFLIRTLFHLKRPWTLSIFGKGSEKDDIRMHQLVDELGLTDNISFMGFNPQWRTNAAKFNYLVFPSVCEGMPNVVVEALCEGLPAVVCRIPEMKDLVTHESNGFLFKADDRAELLDILECLPISGPDYKKMAEAAQEHARMFSDAWMVDRYVALYNDLAIQKT